MSPEELEFMRRVMDANERRSFAAKLEDLGHDDCAVCRSNRMREAWDSESTPLEHPVGGGAT